MDSGGVVVFLYKGTKHFELPVTKDLTAEEVCLTVAKFLNFRPTALHLFALRLKSTHVWLPACFIFEQRKTYNADFRFRFKLPTITDLSRLDENAFDYCYHQTRHDLLAERIPSIIKDNRSEVLGLCVTDMLITIQEQGLTLREIEGNYKKYIPEKIYNKYFLFLKKKVMEPLTALHKADKKRDSKFLKEQYLSQVEDLAPMYMIEEFQAFKGDEFPASVRVDPYNKDRPGVSISYIGKKTWDHVCSIEDLCFVSIRSDNTAEISRKNGIPIMLKFKSIEEVQSFVSVLDGYYRICEKWTFNLCRELPTPSLSKLRAFKCHGPVGEKFANQKLAVHPNSTIGSYIIRQSSIKWGNYAIDYVFNDKNNPITKEIELTASGKYCLEDEIEEFSTVPELILHYVQNPVKDIRLKDCIPPSEYDLSALVMGRKQDFSLSGKTLTGDKLAGSSAPQCITARNLHVFKGKKYELDGKMCKVVKAIWKPSKNTSMTVAIKYLKKEYEDKLMKDFLEMADKCVLWHCESLIPLRGMVLGNPQAMVMDWMPLGTLNSFLQENSLILETVDLIEAAGQIAKAVWYLEDHGIVHGNIRCHNVLVQEHSESFTVKLADPSIPEYSMNDIHWIPPELYENPSLARVQFSADVWAFGTTLWEVFSYGESPPLDTTLLGYRARYTAGWRLRSPPKCPQEIYRIISECWSMNPDCRKQPQAAVRDIHQILYQLIGSKRVHAYATVTNLSISSEESPQANGGLDSGDCNWETFGTDGADHSLSGGTCSTFIHGSSTRSDSTNLTNRTQFTWLFGGTTDTSSPDLISGFSAVYSNGSIRTVYSTGSAQGIYEFETDQVTLGREIGQGCYGIVYMGEVLRSDGSTEQVAVKKMRDSIPEEYDDEFHREIDILKGLNHPNIVEVKGIVRDPAFLLIMEYVPMGSLKFYFRTANTKPSLRQLIKFAQDICEGMEYLVSYNIVHRDLAARNILVANDDLVKISDFGLARFTDNDNCYKLRTDRKLPVQWYPPESLQQWKFSEHSDVWSYGVTLYEIFSFGKNPTLPGLKPSGAQEHNYAEELADIIRLLGQGVRLPKPNDCPDVVYSNLMLPCWSLNPNDRPTFSKLRGDIHNVEIHLF